MSNDNFQQIFGGRGYSLSSLESAGVAFDYPTAMEVIEWYKNNKVIILGGDVLSRNHDELEFTYDSWYYNPTQNAEDCLLSYNKAKQYIEHYHKNNGSNFYYLIVPKSSRDSTTSKENV